MSRKISLKDKKEWLSMFEEGKTEAQIARILKRDPRTITKGIEEAIKDRRLTHAEDDLLRDALRGHQEQLQGVLEGIRSIFAMPSSSLELLEDESGIPAPISISSALVKFKSNDFVLIEITNENDLKWELLHEHLKQDHLWDSINQWRTALIDYFCSIWQFKKMIRNRLEEATGIKLVIHPGSKVAEYLLPEGINLIFEVKMKEILNPPDQTNLEDTVFAGDDKFLRNGVGGARYVYCETKTEYKNKFIEVLSAFSSLPEANEMKSIHERLAWISQKAKREVEEIQLLNLVQGRCRVCRRLGR